MSPKEKGHKRHRSEDKNLRKGELGVILASPEKCCQCHLEIAAGETCSYWRSDGWYMHLGCRDDLHELACCTNEGANPYGAESSVNGHGEWVELVHGDLWWVAEQAVEPIPGGANVGDWINEKVVAQLSDFRSFDAIFKELRKTIPSSDTIRAEWAEKKKATAATK